MKQYSKIVTTDMPVTVSKYLKNNYNLHDKKISYDLYQKNAPMYVVDEHGLPTGQILSKTKKGWKIKAFL